MDGGGEGREVEQYSVLATFYCFCLNNYASIKFISSTCLPTYLATYSIWPIPGLLLVL